MIEKIIRKYKRKTSIERLKFLVFCSLTLVSLILLIQYSVHHLAYLNLESLIENYEHDISKLDKKNKAYLEQAAGYKKIEDIYSIIYSLKKKRSFILNVIKLMQNNLLSEMYIVSLHRQDNILVIDGVDLYSRQVALFKQRLYNLDENYSFSTSKVNNKNYTKFTIQAINNGL